VIAADREAYRHGRPRLAVAVLSESLGTTPNAA
jgi:hypothetical protein